jgi:hypothetical protein
VKLRLFALVAALGAAGCADNRMSVQISAQCAPTDDCSFSESCDAQFIGTVEVAGPSVLTPLFLFLEVANQLPNNTNLDVGRVNNNDAHITNFIIELEGANSGAATIPVTNQVVRAGGTSVIGLPIWFGTALGPTTARIRAIGYYDNGAEFETGDFPVNYWVVGAIAACPAGEFDMCPGYGNQYPRACAAP